jgi:hypothetical protein
VTAIPSPSSVSNATLADNTPVMTMGPIVAGLSQIPQGADGTVIAALGNGGTCEVLFGPPVSAAETVTESLLAVA